MPDVEGTLVFGALLRQHRIAAGLTQEEAGKRVVEWCREHGLLEAQGPYRHSIAVCERCASRIESVPVRPKPAPITLSVMVAAPLRALWRAGEFMATGYATMITWPVSAPSTLLA